MNQAQEQQQQIDNQKQDEPGLSQSIPGMISVKVKILTQLQDIQTSVSVPQKTKFLDLCPLIKQFVFGNLNQKQFDDTIKFQYKDQELSSNDERTLKEIGIKDQETINVRLQLKGGVNYE